MSTSKGSNLERLFANRVFFYSLTNLLLVAFGWLAGWWMKGRSFEAYAQSDYFSNPFRIMFVIYIIIEAIIDFVVSPRWIRPKDEVPHAWIHDRARMWETVLVVAVFSDCMRILPISSGVGARWGGAALLIMGLIPYIFASINRRQYLADTRGAPFPTKGIFGVFRSPESLSAVVTEFGAALIFNTWPGVFCAVIAFVVHLGYARDQDRMMLEKYGNVWSEYQNMTSFKWFPRLFKLNK
jgi:protein-S-isoprenylcysteine O-methyltransferase Ste14